MANTTNFSIEKPSVGGARNSWGGIANVGTDKIDELLALAMPLGTIQMYPLATAPTATANGGTWLVCDGGSLARVGNYAPLFALIGTTYGIGSSSDSSTFSLPDMRTRVPLGYSSATVGSGDAQRTPKAIAASGGEESHTLTEAELRGHTHPLPLTTHVHDFTTDDKATGITETNLAKANIVLNDHSHSYNRLHNLGSGSPATGTHSAYLVNNSAGPAGSTNSFGGAAMLDEDGVDNDGHKHTLTDPEHQHTGTTDPKVTGITATSNTGTVGGAQHENLSPYLVLNYIILAKHPSF